MAFYPLYQCEYCGKIRRFRDDDEATCADCGCEEGRIAELVSRVDAALGANEMAQVARMSSDESKARYREQYIRNGYTWPTGRPHMFMGAIEGYPPRNIEDDQ